MNMCKERKMWDACKAELPERCVVIEGVIAVILPTSTLSSQSCMVVKTHFKHTICSRNNVFA